FFIRPTYWETPMPEAPDLPPPALRALHFQPLPLVAPAEVARPSPVPAPAAAAPPAPPAPPPPPAAPAPVRPDRVASRPPRTPRLAVAGVLFVALVGGTIRWTAGRVVVPNPGSAPDVDPPPQTKADPATPLAAVSPDGRLAAVLDASARIVISRGDAPAAVERVIQTSLARADVVALRFSSDGTRIVCEPPGGGTAHPHPRTLERSTPSA